MSRATELARLRRRRALRRLAEQSALEALLADVADLGAIADRHRALLERRSRCTVNLPRRAVPVSAP